MKFIIIAAFMMYVQSVEKVFAGCEVAIFEMDELDHNGDLSSQSVPPAILVPVSVKNLSDAEKIVASYSQERSKSFKDESDYEKSALARRRKNARDLAEERAGYTTERWAFMGRIELAKQAAENGQYAEARRSFCDIITSSQNLCEVEWLEEEIWKAHYNLALMDYCGKGINVKLFYEGLRYIKKRHPGQLLTLKNIEDFLEEMPHWCDSVGLTQMPDWYKKFYLKQINSSQNVVPFYMEAAKKNFEKTNKNYYGNLLARPYDYLKELEYRVYEMRWKTA